MDVRVGLWKNLSAEELMLLNCVWRRLFRVPWTARSANQSILKEISPGCSLERLMLKLKVQYFGHLMQRVDSLEKPWCWEGFGAGGEGDDRGWDGWMASLTRWTWVWVSCRSWWWTGTPDVLWFVVSQRVGHDWAIELNWTELNTPQTEAVPSQKVRERSEIQSDYKCMGWLISYTNKWGLFQLFQRRGRNFQKHDHCPHFGLLVIGFRSVMSLVGVPFRC